MFDFMEISELNFVSMDSTEHILTENSFQTSHFILCYFAKVRILEKGEMRDNDGWLKGRVK